MFFRAAISSALAIYIAAAPTDDFASLVRLWAWYALIDGIVAVALAPARDVGFGSFLSQGIWSLGAALIGFILPLPLYPVLFVGIPLWSAGSTVLALVGVQQIRDVIEGKWLVALAVLAAAAGAYTFLSSPTSDITWLRATISGFSVANSVVFLLTALSVRAGRTLG